MDEQFIVYQELGDIIKIFLDKYANFNVWDDSDETYSSPDAEELFRAYKLLRDGKKPCRVYSEWGSGGYSPYNDRKARKEHDKLVELINELSCD